MKTLRLQVKIFYITRGDINDIFQTVCLYWLENIDVNNIFIFIKSNFLFLFLEILCHRTLFVTCSSGKLDNACRWFSFIGMHSTGMHSTDMQCFRYNEFH